MTRPLSLDDYRALARFRRALRTFQRFSETAARRGGLTPAQHQLLLAIRGSASDAGPSVGEVAEALLVRHHTASELVDRAQQLGLVERSRSDQDGRRVQLRLTREGRQVLEGLTAVHLEELGGLGRLLDPLAAHEPRPQETSP